MHYNISGITPFKKLKLHYNMYGIIPLNKVQLHYVIIYYGIIALLCLWSGIILFNNV